MTPQDDPGTEEIRPVPPGQEEASLQDSLRQADEQQRKDGKARLDKELKALERVQAKHAAKAEKAAAKAGVDRDALQADLEALRGLPVTTEEEAREAERRGAAIAEQHRPSRDDLLAAAGIDADDLAEELMATVQVPEHARAVGRRGAKGGGGRPATAGDDSLGWVMEVE
ncbi:hypothetical protein [Ornithinimicrobium tianjinense]|uniref:Scaffolding protein n=1 Tax=Ornithinimicrobium tianjinense TaxID=1195761 RepID=A0A917BH29_9MICO|nr:hypothetical protein [Ornithinimicrobium tianjinense]GGF38689.1 hypothetical protein GCM10011366_02830 [Ornithinimicrobium tianjinense]